MKWIFDNLSEKEGRYKNIYRILFEDQNFIIKFPHEPNFEESENRIRKRRLFYFTNKFCFEISRFFSSHGKILNKSKGQHHECVAFSA